MIQNAKDVNYTCTHLCSTLAMESAEEQQQDRSIFGDRTYANPSDIVQSIIKVNQKLHSYILCDVKW